MSKNENCQFNKINTVTDSDEIIILLDSICDYSELAVSIIIDEDLFQHVNECEMNRKLGNSTSITSLDMLSKTIASENLTIDNIESCLTID